MKKPAIILLGIVLVPLLTGYELPSSETVELRSYHDQYTLEETVPVFVKTDSTYESGLRVVQVRIGPQRFRVYEKTRNLYEDRNNFHTVLVSIVLSDTRGQVSKDFQSYLNYEECEGSGERGHLFWDHAGEERADKAGQVFGPDPLIVKDDYVEVTMSLGGVFRSPYPCDPDEDVYCESDSDCLVYIDVLTLKVTTAYTVEQEELQSSLQEALAYTGAAVEFFQNGEFKKAKDEYEKAKDIYDEIDDTERFDTVQEQIDTCNSYINANDDLAEGIRLFQEAAGTEDYKEAIEKYEEARSYFEKAQNEYDTVENTAQSDECQIWIDRCNDEIENLENVGKLRARLLYIVGGIAIVAAAGAAVKMLRKEKAPKVKGLTLKALNAETGEEVVITVDAFDKIGKVRQVAGTQLGVIPFGLLYNGRECPPDRTVEECGLEDGAVVEVVLEKVQEVEQLKKVEPAVIPGAKPKIIYGSRGFPLTKGVTTIGRGEKVDIQIKDPEKHVSRLHAKIYQENGEYWIEDNNSANGTFVYKDGEYKKIQKEVLHDKDVIVLARDPKGVREISIVFEAAPSEEMYKKTRMVKEAKITVDGEEFPLAKDVTTIGRGEKADIQIKDPERAVSRLHAKIYQENGEYLIEDNNSANGTFVYKDGEYKKIQKEVLQDGDVIVLSYDSSRSTQVTLQFKAN